MKPEIVDLASHPTAANDVAPACEIFRAQVRRRNGDLVKVHLKVLTPEALACEILVSSLAKQIGVPVPDCYIVRVKKPQFDLFQSSARWKRIRKGIEKNGADVVALYASTTLDHPTVDHRLEGDNHTPSILAFIAEIAKLETAAIFDEWIGNPDRHFENILIADMKTWWLIDHDLSFNQREFEYKELKFDELFGNFLAEELLPNPLPASLGRKWIKEAEMMESQLKGCNSRDQVKILRGLNFLSPVQAEKINEFLDQRAICLSLLIRERLRGATEQLSLFGGENG